MKYDNIQTVWRLELSSNKQMINYRGVESEVHLHFMTLIKCE